jgi:hypothetical protein
MDHYLLYFHISFHTYPALNLFCGSHGSPSAQHTSVTRQAEEVAAVQGCVVLGLHLMQLMLRRIALDRQQQGRHPAGTPFEAALIEWYRLP